MVVALVLSGCVKDPWEAPPPPPPVEAGEPMVGAAEGYLELPVGTPLGGFTSRCTCLGGNLFQPDPRDSELTTSFIESSGVHTWPAIKAIWLEAGGEPLVLTKVDTIYSADALVEAITARLEEATGEELSGRVVLATNHSHSSFGTFHPGATWFLGSDRFDRENFERFADQVAEVALQAHGTREPAKVGVGWTEDWDPSDRVYSDRRGENDELTIWDDQERPLGKDPFLGVLRFDTLDDEPIALAVNFGMHGIVLDIDNAMVSTDSGGGIEAVLSESFGDRPVVTMFLQGSGGDASPRGEQDRFARIESLGEIARDAVLAAREATPTSSDPVSIETVSRHVWKHPSSIHVTRDGAVDWSYAPFDPDPEFDPDNVVYDDDGSLRMPIDEFNTELGAVFCGSGDLDVPVGGLASTIFPYNQCLQVELLATLMGVWFQLPEGEPALPLPESLQAGTTASRIGPLPVRMPDGSEDVHDQLVGFFPGEPLYAYGEQWRRRAEAELGFEQAMIVGYAQDHEGYLTVPEDWLVGGYEPDITVWGPLEAEHVMEDVLTYAEQLTTELREPMDPLGQYAMTPYAETPLPTRVIDPTPDAGERLPVAPAYLWTPFVPAYDPDDAGAIRRPADEEMVIPAQLPRVQGVVQLAWEGGDPIVDSPHVVLERQDGGSWVPVTTPAGRVIDEGRHDVLLAHTPDPLYPAEDLQTHAWWAGWQAVSHVADRAGLPLGRYRLHVTGSRWVSGDQWPYETAPYEVISEEFEVVPAQITVAYDGATLTASLAAPVNGWRLVALGGDENGDNPVPGPVEVEIESGAGVDTQTVEPATAYARSALPVPVPADWTRITVTDAYGNTGTLFP